MLNNFCFRIVLLCTTITLTLFVTGCWDHREIENQGFVLGVAIDYAKSPEPKGQYDLPSVTQEAGSRKYLVTYEVPGKVITEKQEGAGDEEESHFLFSGEGESMLTITRAISAKTSLKLFFEDMQIIVFSEKVAREGIGDILDFYLRDHEMRRRVKLLVAPGRAEDILTSKLQIPEVNSVYIAKTMKNVSSIPRFASKADFADISKAIRNKRSFYMPIIMAEKGDIKLTKAAIFNKDKKMVGEVNEYEIIGGKILNKRLKEGVFTILNPNDPEDLVAFELLESNIKVNSHLEGDKLWFTVEAKFIGSLGENTQTKQKVLDPAFSKMVEQELANSFTRQVEAAYQKHQELRTDPLGLGTLVYRHYPRYWETIEDIWDDEVFPTVPLDVDIKVVVRRTGLTR